MILKPARIVTEVGEAAPEWEWFWEIAKRVWPLSARAGVPRDLVTGLLATAIEAGSGSVGWSVGLQGTATHQVGGGANVNPTDKASWDLGGSIAMENWTVIWSGIPSIVTTSALERTLFSCEDFGETDETSGRDAFIIKSVSGPGVSTGRVEAHVNGTGNVLDNIGLVIDAENTVILTRSGATVTVYVNDALMGTITVSSATGLRNYQFPRLGNHRFSATENEFAQAQHSVAYVLGEAISAEQAAQIFADVLGPITPAEDVFGGPFAAAPAGGIQVLRRRRMAA